MSDSESDSLEFESADEDVKGEDIDTSDLELDEELEKKPKDSIKPEESSSASSQGNNHDSINQTKQNNLIEENPAEIVKEYLEESVPSQVQTLQSNDSIDQSEKLETKLDALDLNEPKSDPIDSPEELNQADHRVEEPLNREEPSQENKVVGWDESELSELEDTPNNKIDAKVSDWNDAELSDIDDEPLKQSDGNLTEKAGWDEAELGDVDNLEIEPQATELKKAESEEQSNKKSAWSSWSSFGSNFISTASKLGSGISAVLESVEANVIGAPDPRELAKLQKEKSIKELEEFNNEHVDGDQPKWENSNWDEDGQQEWFSMVN